MKILNYIFNRHLSRDASRPVSNLHPWIIILITAFLILVYLAWPWREWQFYTGFWPYFSWLSSLYSLSLFELKYHFIGSLFMIPIIYTSLIYKWQASVILSLLILVVILPMLNNLYSSFANILTNIVFLLSPITIVLLIKIVLELQKKDKQIYLDREKERQIYLGKIIETQERERQRLAEELHDESVQVLLAVASHAEFMKSDNVNDLNVLKKKAEWIENTVLGVVEELRKISVELRPKLLDTLGLIPAIRWLCERTETENKIKVNLTIVGFTKSPLLNQSIEVNLFRIIQESLRNISRHANASKIVISLEERENSMRIVIRDNGCGFIPPANYSHLAVDGKLGIIGMMERIRTLSGKFEIHSQIGKGTTLVIDIPKL